MSEDINPAIEKFNNSLLKHLLIIVQTTFELEKFEYISNLINRKLNNRKDIEIEIKKTICSATKIRQIETEKISKQVDLMIIIGGKNSLNTDDLYKISKRNCEHCVKIESYKDLKKKEIEKYNKIGIMAGTSTPKESIDEVINFINIRGKNENKVF